jgi:hypothetical protein
MVTAETACSAAADGRFSYSKSTATAFSSPSLSFRYVSTASEKSETCEISGSTSSLPLPIRSTTHSRLRRSVQRTWPIG